MSKKRTNEIYRCWKCGITLSNGNCRKSSDGITGYVPLCIDCEEKWLADIAQVQGVYEGLFSACIAFNVPCVPRILDGVDLTVIDSPWKAYLRLLKDNDEYSINEIPRGFKDGVKSIFGVFGNDLQHKDFAARIKQEITKIQVERKRKQQDEERLRKERENLGGTEKQIAKWGKLPIYKGLNWSQDLYDELDRIYETRASAYKGVDLNGQQQAILVKVAKNDAIYDHLMRTGLVKLATDIQKSTSQLLADENMRPKDKKPVEELRLDALVLALEEAGLMENGDLLTYDELIEVMRDNFVKSKKYDYSLDVADQMILDVINSMRANADLPYIQDLPEEFAPVDEYGEFEPEETEREKENKRFLGITKVNIVKSDKGEN